jgi:hypothetical protein
MKLYTCNKIWCFLLIGLAMVGCDRKLPDADTKKALMTANPKNVWLTHNENSTSGERTLNLPSTADLLSTQNEIKDKSIVVNLKCTDKFLYIDVIADETQFSTTPLYSNVDKRWAHSFEVRIMNNAESLNSTVLARRSERSTNFFTISKINPMILYNYETFFKFQLKSKDWVHISFDDRVRMVARSCSGQL